MYLSSPRVNIAEESVEDHRVQLQCKFDEKEGKYTEAKPRCTCPSYESNLHQVGEVQHQLPLDLMLVHFRPHLCSGYTDQYHSFLQKVKSLMITEQNGILIHLGTILVKNPILPFGHENKSEVQWVLDFTFKKKVKSNTHWTSLFLPLDFTLNF